MPKHAFLKKESTYPILYEPLPVPSEAPIFRDKAPAILPFAEDFPKLHFHDRYEIGICESGEGLFLAGGEFFSISPGTALLLPPGMRHYSRSVDPQHPCTVRFAYLLPKPLTALLSSLPEVHAEQILSGFQHKPTVLRDTCAERIREAVRSCPVHDDAVSLCTLSLLLLELSGERSTSRLEDPPRDGVANALAEHLALHYAENETAGELAALFHLSESQLRRKFVATYGQAPITYRNTLRCKIAAELLVRTNTAIGAISERLGYSAPVEFYRSFRKHFGLSPSEYRKSNS